MNLTFKLLSASVLRLINYNLTHWTENVLSPKT